ncbi:hypothetical protein D3C74_337800 [compost metagenome]
MVGALAHDERPQEVVPVPQEDERAERREDRLAQGQHDAREDAPLGGAVELGGLEELVRHVHDELPHEEHGLRVRERRQDQAPVGVQAADLRHEDEGRDEGHVVRDHDHREERPEHGLAARELLLGERVARHRGEREDQDHRDDRVDERVPEPGPDVARAEHALVGREAQVRGDQALRELDRRRRLEREHDHRVEREDRDDRGEAQHDVPHDLAAQRQVHARALAAPATHLGREVGRAGGTGSGPGVSRGAGGGERGHLSLPMRRRCTNATTMVMMNRATPSVLA